MHARRETMSLESFPAPARRQSSVLNFLSDPTVARLSSSAGSHSLSLLTFSTYQLSINIFLLCSPVSSPISHSLVVVAGGGGAPNDIHS